MVAWAPVRLILAHCGVSSVTPRSTNSSAATSTSLALAANQSRTMREKSRPASVFSFSRAIFFGFTCIATAAATERAMSLAVGLSWKAYSILPWAILSPILSDAEQQVTTGIDAFWNSSITRMNTSLERKPIPTWILSTVSARVTTLSPTSPLPSSSYQMTRTLAGLPPTWTVAIRSSATSAPAFTCAPTSALIPEMGRNAPSRISSCAEAARGAARRATARPSRSGRIVVGLRMITPPRGEARGDARWRDDSTRADAAWTRGPRALPGARGPPVGADRAALHHQLDARGIQQHRDVVEGIARDQHQVGEAPLLDGADLALEPETRGGPLGGRAQRLHRAEPGLDQVLELERVLRMPVAARVGARRDRHPELERASHARHVVCVERDRALPHVGRRALAMVDVHREGGHEEGALDRHLAEQGRVLVQIAPVLDRVDARGQRGAEPGAAERVTHHPTAERAGLGHERLHLREREGGVKGPVARARAGAPGGRGLDHVGAGSRHRAHHVAHRVRPVGHAGRQQRVVGAAAVVARRAHPVADAAGRRDDLQRQHQPRPRDQPLLDGQLESRVEPARVAHGGVAHRERLREHARGAQVGGAGRLVQAEPRGEAVAVGGEMIVGVDQARNQGPAARVDDLRVGGPAEAGARPHRADPV